MEAGDNCLLSCGASLLELPALQATQRTDDPNSGPEHQMVQPLRIVQTPALLAALVAALGCAGRTQAQARDPSPQPTSPPASAPPRAVPPSTKSPEWLTVDAAAKTASITLEVHTAPNALSATLNGYRNGEARIVVPVGWTVRWSWRNGDTSSHSLVVMVQREKIPLEGGRPAFSNAMTRMVTEGLPQGQTDQTTFEAEEAGWYWLMCGVPDHALKGEWLELRVDPAATTARVELKKLQE
jgi:plastocyanin